MNRNALAIEVTQFAGMAHVDDVEPVCDKDLAVLEQIRAVLMQHGAVDRFGVHLLHTHYPVADDEVIVEYTDESARTQMTRVEKRAEVFSIGRPLETQWRFNRDGAAAICIGYCHYNSGHRYIHQHK